MNMPTDTPQQGRAPEWAALRAALADARPPEQVEAALLRALTQRPHRPRPWIDPVSWLSIGALGALAALLVAGVHAPPLPAPAPAPPAALALADPGFVPLANLTATQMAAAHPQLTRTVLSRSTLVALGVPIADHAPDELIRTELLVAASGEALAVRLSLN